MRDSASIMRRMMRLSLQREKDEEDEVIED
jgi:hypothetical protein